MTDGQFIPIAMLNVPHLEFTWPCILCEARQVMTEAIEGWLERTFLIVPMPRVNLPGHKPGKYVSLDLEDYQ